MASFSRTDVQVYERFRAWVNKQPPEEQQGEPLDAYRRVLAAEGLSASETERQIRRIIEQGQELEIDRWNRILTAPQPPSTPSQTGFSSR